MPTMQSLEKVIGNTPLVQLNRVPGDCDARICLKMEGDNPGKSVKDRLGWGMIRDLEESKEIAPGKTTLIEATSGNTGIALAMLGAARGYKVILTMPEQMSLERRVVLRSYGARVVLTPKAKGVKGALIKAQQLEDEINKDSEKTGQNARVTWQFETDSNARIHRETTGPEIWRDTKGEVAYVVSGIGTGGTLSGVAQYIREMGGKTKFIAVEPDESAAISHLREGKDFAPKPHMVQGMGAGFVPNTLDMECVDEVIRVPSVDAVAMAKRLPREEGLLVGISTGAITCAALEIAKRPEAKGKLIVAIAPSQGERYMSTPVFADIMEQSRQLPVMPEGEFPEDFVQQLRQPDLIPPKGPFAIPKSGGIKASVSEVIGGTPLLALRRTSEAAGGNIFGKLEMENPGKSVKDRLALALIQDAEAAGLATPGKTALIESTSGNTGIALAMIGAARGYKVILTMPDSMSLERRAVLKAFGAEVVLTTAKKGLNGARFKAQQIHDEIVAGGGHALLTHQFENMSNALVHKQTTGMEIWNDTDGKVDFVVSGVGTGGTITGIAQCFKEQGNTACKFIGVEPQESQAMGHKMSGSEEKFKPSPHKIQGMGAGFVPNSMDLGVVDQVIPIASDEAIRTSQELAQQEGLLVGISTGAIVAAAKRVAASPEGKGKNIVAIIPSAGERYLTSALFTEIMEECRAMVATSVD
eukprot:TRINITY_DN43528_c0_g1_i1.p1 TRINITY_DN43528_c0_g1~~TRINITY_DN43528_c0_g1_i1.p1  ORF type:complete len:730 (+),score=229.92 TRINITY_DN43528_c0_g1_i1:94-2190(+)